MWFNWICVLVLIFGKELVRGANALIAFQEARKAPFCITAKDEIWGKIGSDYKKFQEYLKNTDTHFKDKSTDLFTIKLTKLKLEFDKIEKDVKTHIVPTKFMGGGETLNQWIHIQIKPREKIKGLLVQANRGPIGLPFGEFTPTRDRSSDPCKCNDCNFDMGKNSMTIPCTYRPRDSIVHPNVYAYYGAPQDQIHLNFKFTDVFCQRASLITFLVMVVTENGAEIGMTDIYELEKPMSNDGSAYPFHPDFCKALACEAEDAGFKENTALKMMYSMEYDGCVLEGKKDKKSCPPGPFKCPFVDKPNAGDAELAADAAEGKKINVDIFTPCSCRQDQGVGKIDKETPPPDVKAPSVIVWEDNSKDVTEEYRDYERPTGLITAIDYVEPERIISDDFLDKISFTDEDIIGGATVKIVHGIFMIVAFAFLASVSFFVSRFDKDVLPGVGCCAKGMWIWCHALLAIIAMGLIFGGLFMLFMHENLNFEDILLIALHMPFGILAVLSFFFVYLTAWIRPISTDFRTKFILVHAILGYVSKLCAVISLLGILNDKNAGYALGLFSILELLSLMFYGVGSLILQLTYKRMQLKNMKRVCPFPEHQELEEPVPKSCANIRDSAFGLYFFVMLTVVLFGVIFYPPPFLRSYFDLLRAPGSWPFVEPTKKPNEE